MSLASAPADVRVVFRDYDIEGYDERHLTQDRDGAWMLETVKRGTRRAHRQRQRRCWPSSSPT